MNQNSISSAEIGVGVQAGGGPVTYEFGYVIERVLRDATESFRVKSLDARVGRLAFLLRISGTFTVFEGHDVENVKFGRHRSSISVDWLYAQRHTKIRDVGTLVSLALARLQMTPEVLAAICVRRDVKINLQLFQSECNSISKDIECFAKDFKRFKTWKESAIESEREIVPKYRSFM